MSTEAIDDERQHRRKQTEQQQLDSILDAALDALDDDSSENDDGVVGGFDSCDGVDSGDGDGDGDGDGGTTAMLHQADNGRCDDDDPIMGVPYSLEYLANTNINERRRIEVEAEARRRRRRPQFGPEPPPPPGVSSSPLSTLPPFDPSIIPNAMGGEDELAVSLEGMMKQFTEELGKSGMNPNDFGGLDGIGGGDDGSAEKALDEMFKQMMMGEGQVGFTANNGPASNTMSASSSSHSVSSAAANNNNTNNSGTSTPRKSNHATKSNKQEPNVDESINRLLDGINQATNAPLPDPNLPPPPGMMPDNIDPAQFEKLSEEMMNSIMGEFNKMSNANDSNDVVDSVMKQLLDKELMYTPMKEVCTRFPAWLAKHKAELSTEDYERYGKQYQYFQKIVHVYETDPQNFDRLMELMQDIQEYGQPPVEIIKELAPELEFDEEGMPIMDPTKGMMGGAGDGGMMNPMMMMPGMSPFPGGNGNEQCCIS